jgi:hypothetical protein
MTNPQCTPKPQEHKSEQNGRSWRPFAKPLSTTAVNKNAEEKKEEQTRGEEEYLGQRKRTSRLPQRTDRPPRNSAGSSASMVVQPVEDEDGNG